MHCGSADFLRAFLLVSGVLMAGIVLLNRAVDPYHAYRRFPSDLFREFQVKSDTRIAKAELASHFTGTTVLVGSSRVLVGCDPESPAIPNGPACNLGITGTNFYELSHVLGFILRQPRVRRIVLSLDFHQFGDARAVNYDFDISRFNPDLQLFDYHCNLLFGSDAARASLKTLQSYIGGRQGETTPLGFRRPETMAVRKQAAEVAKRSLLAALTNREVLRGYRYSEQRVAALEQIVRECRAAEVKLLVVIHPVHAVMLESYRCAGLWETHEQWVRDVVHVVTDASDGRVPVWDFTTFGPYTTEPLLTSPAENPGANRWFWEPSHCKAELGEQMLRRIFDHPHADPDFGRRLSPDRLPQHFAQIRKERQTWMHTHRNEALLVRQLVAETGYEAEIAVALAPDETPAR